jgi:hypothetical protein
MAHVIAASATSAAGAASGGVAAGVVEDAGAGAEELQAAVDRARATAATRQR